MRSIILIAIMAIILGIGMIVFQNRELSYPDPGNKNAIQNSISIGNQQAGTTVIVDSATLDKPGFVVIEGSGISSPASSVILAAGENKSVFIGVATQKGKQYKATLYADNGDGKFTSADTVLNGASGKPATATFKAL